MLINRSEALRLYNHIYSLRCNISARLLSLNPNDETADIIAASDWMTLSCLLEIK